MAVTRRQPVHAVLYLIVAFLGTAALFFLLGAPLLAAFVVILYAGAIMVLVLFVIMLFQRSPRELGLLSEWGPAALLGVVFFAVAVAMVFKDPGSGIVLQGAVVQPGISVISYSTDTGWRLRSSPSCSSLPWWPSFIWAREGSGGDEAERK